MSQAIQYHDDKGRAAWGAIMIDDAPAPPAPEPLPADQSSRADQLLTWGAKKARLCGYGSDLNWSVRFADALFVDCACCLVWRGLFLGTIGGGVIGAVVGFLIGRFL